MTTAVPIDLVGCIYTTKISEYERMMYVMTLLSQIIRKTSVLCSHKTKNHASTILMPMPPTKIIASQRPFLFMMSSAYCCTNAIGMILLYDLSTELSYEDDMHQTDTKSSQRNAAAASTNDSFSSTSRLILQHSYQNTNQNRFTYCDSVDTGNTSMFNSKFATSASSSSSSSGKVASYGSDERNSQTTNVNTNSTTINKSNIQRQMTSIGRFALVSETIYNPSIITFVLQLENEGQNNKPLTANDFTRLWLAKQMPQRHPRFHQILNDSSTDLKRTKGTRIKSSMSSSSLSFHPTILTDISQHVTESILPCNRLELQRIVGNMQLARWDLSDSLWQVTICNNNITNSIMSSPMYNGNNIPTSFITHMIDEINQTSNESSNKDLRRLPPTLLLFRGHHVLADGASMAAAFMDLFDEADALRNQILTAVQQYRLRRHRRKRSIWQRLWRKWVQLVQFCYGTIQSFLQMFRLLYYQAVVDQNPWKIVEQKSKIGQASATATRVVSWSDVATVEQVKWVADTLSGDDGDVRKDKGKSTFKITVNDVFIACVTAAMSKQLQYHRQRMQELSHNATANAKVLDEQRFIHVAVPVHLKGGVVLPDESVSNCIGALVARVPCEMNEDESCPDNDRSVNNSVERLRAVSSELHTIKRTPTAIISYIMAKALSNITTMNIFPSSWMSYLYSNANAGSMVVVSNNRGPSMPVHIDGHKVESIAGFVPLPPGIPVGLVVMSYAGRINCALSAESWAVPDGDQFMLWILEEYLQLVTAAKLKQAQKNGLQ